MLNFAARDVDLNTFDVSLTAYSLAGLTIKTIANLIKEKRNDTAMAANTTLPSAGICRSASCSSSRCRTACCQADTGELLNSVNVS